MDLNTEQKIDYIFESIKKRETTEKRNLYIKWGFRLFMLAYFYYFTVFALPWLMKSFIPTFPSLWGTSSSEVNPESVDTNILKSVLENYLKN